MIPLAVAYFSKEEIGLWAVVSTTLTYLLWMDLGVGASTGRVLADGIAARDQDEVNRWWTTTRAVLCSQAALLMLGGILITPVVINFLDVPADLRPAAREMIVVASIIGGLSLPMRGVSGLLTSQERFHWVPLVQATTLWLNFGVFYLCLRAGFGLRSYLIGMAAGLLATFLMNEVLVRTGPGGRPRWNKEGLARWRFKRLFSLSGNVTVIGLVDTVLASLPRLILGKQVGLSLIPVYDFSAKGPMLGGGLMSRTYQSFYPQLQTLHISGRHQLFAAKHRQIGMLTLGFAVLGAAGVLLLNPLFVQLVAGSDFYAGSGANLWFAVALISLPLAGVFRILLMISGSMGYASLVSVLKLAVAGIAAVVGWRWYGLAGIAAVFALVPLASGTYAYIHGTRACGFPRHGISASVAVTGLLAILAVIACGLLLNEVKSEGMSLRWLGRDLVLPSLTMVVAVMPLVALGLLVTARSLYSFRATRVLESTPP